MPVKKKVGAEAQRLNNKSTKTLTKTKVAKAENIISEKNLEAAERATRTAVSSLDRSAQKKIIHPNKASRTKSRLMKKLNAAKTAK